MKINMSAVVYFDGTTLALAIFELAEAGSTKVFLGDRDEGAKVIEFLRAKALDVYDRRLKREPEPKLTVAKNILSNEELGPLGIKVEQGPLELGELAPLSSGGDGQLPKPLARPFLDIGLPSKQEEIAF